MARVRIENTRLNSWDDVALNLKEIGECQIAIEGIEARMNEQISDTKLSAAIEAKPYQERIKKMELEIKEFTEDSRGDFIKNKTKFLDFGNVGFRQSTKIVIKSIQAALNGLKARNMTDCIKVSETVDKERLREYPDEIIAALGATKKIEDVFWYEVDRTKLAQ